MTRDAEGIDAVPPAASIAPNTHCDRCGRPLADHDRCNDVYICRRLFNFVSAGPPPPRIPDDEMPGPCRPAQLPIPLGVYRHLKSGRDYLVTGGSLFATGDDQRVDVCYYSIADGYQAHRTYVDFVAPTGAGIVQPRFQLVEALTPAEVATRLAVIVEQNLLRLEEDATP